MYFFLTQKGGGGIFIYLFLFFGLGIDGHGKARF